MDSREAKQRYERMQLKNGWDLPQRQKPPVTGRKRQMARAYELLVLKTDEEYIQEAASNGEKVIESIPGMESSLKVQTGADGSASLNNNISKYTSDKYSSDTRLQLELLSREEWQQKKRRRRMLMAGIVAALILVFGGRLLIGPPILIADISDYEAVSIEVEGLADEPITITAADLARMKKTSTNVDVHNGELADGEVPEEGKAIGPSLETFLKKYGKTTDDFRSVRVYSENENSKAYVQTMQDETIILSVANGRKPLGEKEAPLRIAIADQSTDEWFGWVRKIVFTPK